MMNKKKVNTELVLQKKVVDYTSFINNIRKNVSHMSRFDSSSILSAIISRCISCGLQNFCFQQRDVFQMNPY